MSRLRKRGFRSSYCLHTVRTPDQARLARRAFGRSTDRESGPAAIKAPKRLRKCYRTGWRDCRDICWIRQRQLVGWLHSVYGVLRLRDLGRIRMVMIFLTIRSRPRRRSWLTSGVRSTHGDTQHEADPSHSHWHRACEYGWNQPHGSNETVAGSTKESPENHRGRVISREPTR